MEKNKKPIIALMYDFDKTLCGKDMQDYSVIPSIGMNSSEFWQEANKLATKTNMDKILAYMYLMIKTAKKNDVPITKEAFTKLGEEVVLLKGVKGWFDRINAYGKVYDVEIEHYILSSGLSEIIEGTPIAKHFKRIYACQFHYNERGNADWPQQAVNYTTKTQFLFRISKGVLDVMDDVTLNSSISEEDRRIPYHNMIYIGDGLTDVPCMRLVKERGGESIAIFHRNDKRIVNKLLKEGRVNYACPADYTNGSMLDTVVKKIIQKMAISQELINTHIEQIKEINEGEENEK
jgi:hypothetical protein